MVTLRGVIFVQATSCKWLMKAVYALPLLRCDGFKRSLSLEGKSERSDTISIILSFFASLSSVFKPTMAPMLRLRA